MLNKIEYILKHNLLIQKIYKKTFSFGFRFIGRFVKRDKKKILFQSMIGKTYSDSPKVLYEAIRKDKCFKGYKYIWAFDDPDKFDVPGAEKIKLNSLRYFIEALKAPIWITNVDIERGLKFKPKGTYYLNTWHGNPIKYVGNAQKTRNDYDYSSVDFMCSFSKLDDEVFIRDFNVKKESLVRCWMPRNDALFHATPEKKKALRNKYGIPIDKKVVFYAPTWRDSTDGGKNYVIAPPINIDYWKEKLGNDYIVLFRMHHLSTKQMGLVFDDFVRNYSGNYDINDLMIMSDMLISDYSGTIFDYFPLEQPIALFAYDYKEYKETRGLYLNLEDIIPGNVFSNEKQLLDFILNMDYEEECKKTIDAKNRYIESAGDATDICMDYLRKCATIV